MEYLLKSSTVILLFYSCFHFFLKKETFFQYNRGFLLTGMIIALVFPLVVIPVYVPAETIAIVLPESEYFNTQTSQISEKALAPTFEWTSLLPLLYGIGFLIFFIQFIFQFGSLAVLVLKNPKNKDGIYTYVTVSHNISPFSFFKWIVYNPENFKNDELKLILTHEKVHASQLHSIDILFTQLACVIFWFNPLIWFYRKAVRQNLEYIADFKTQTASNDEKTYQHLLLKTSVANHQIPLSNNFYNSLIKERIVMLKKSRSSKRKQWRYLLVFPLLAVLLMSLNTKEISVEPIKNSENSENTIEFIVTKKTSVSELRMMSESVKEKGGRLEFSKMKRNQANELTNIFVKLNSHSYGSGNSKDPIKDFLIYKELFGLEAGYLGRLGNGTTHFGTKKLNKVLVKENKALINAFEERVSNVVLKNGLYNAEDLKNLNDHESIDIIITKNTSNENLKSIKETLKNKGITFNYSGIKRNSDGEITSINTEFKSDTNSSNYNISGEKGIKSFRFVSNGNQFSVGTIDKNTLIYKSKNGKAKMQSTNATGKVIVIEEEEEEEDNDDINVDTKTTKAKSTFKIITNDKDSNIFINDDGSEPLFIINGKKVDKSLFEDVDSDDIESIFVLKGDRALKKFGKDGKNGAIIMTKKGTKGLFSDDEDTIILNSKNQFTFETGGKQPLIILNGKVIDQDNLSEVSPNMIENVEVLKDKNAIKTYGKKGENGVIIITSKDDAATIAKDKPIIIEIAEDSPNTFKTAITSVYYMDDNDSKNIEFVINKHSSDAFLDKQKSELKKHGIDAKFSKIKRNKNGDITSIKITLDDNNGRKSSASWREKEQAIPTIVMGKQGKKLFINSQ